MCYCYVVHALMIVFFFKWLLFSTVAELQTNLKFIYTCMHEVRMCVHDWHIGHSPNITDSLFILLFMVQFMLLMFLFCLLLYFIVCTIGRKMYTSWSKQEAKQVRDYFKSMINGESQQTLPSKYFICEWNKHFYHGSSCHVFLPFKAVKIHLSLS